MIFLENRKTRSSFKFCMQFFSLLLKLYTSVVENNKTRMFNKLRDQKQSVIMNRSVLVDRSGWLL